MSNANTKIDQHNKSQLKKSQKTTTAVTAEIKLISHYKEMRRIVNSLSNHGSNLRNKERMKKHRINRNNLQTNQRKPHPIIYK